MDGLLIEWIDPRGRHWNLGTGQEGVMLDTGQEGLEVSEVSHEYARGDAVWASATMHRAQPTLKVFVGAQLTGQDYFDVAEEWWVKANSPLKEGTLRFTRPDGEVRELRCRLRTAPGTSWTYDPGQAFHVEQERAELWALDGASPWWQGKEQTTSFGSAASGGISGVQPFFGSRGYGWPLYIGSNELTVIGMGGATFSNRGQGPMWLTWRLVGPMSSPVVGVPGGKLAYQGDVAPGEVIEIVTEPGKRTVTEVGSGISKFELVSGTFAPLDVGVDIPLTAEAEGMTEVSRVEVSGRAQFARPF